MIKKPDQVKKFLKAKRPEGLTMLMLQNNTKRGAFHEYDIIFAEGFWYAWFMVSMDEIINDKVNEIDDKQ